jgi:PAS domain S-box-containing protein
MLGADGSTLWVEGFMENNTKRKGSQELLRAREAYLRSLFENATVGLYRTTPAGRIVMANPTLVRMLGYSSFEEMAERNLEGPGFEPGYPRSEFRKALEENGTIRGWEAAWTRRNGTIVFVRESARLVKDDQGNALCYEGVVEDITERKHAEESLRESEAKFRAMFECAPDALYLATLSGTVLDVNSAFECLLGYSGEEVIGKTLDDVLLRFPQPEHDWIAAQLERTGKVSGVELATKRRGGEPFIASLSIVKMTMLGKDHIIGAVRDITASKLAEERLRESEERFAAFMSHLPASAFLKDSGGRLLFANRYCEEVFGTAGNGEPGRQTEEDDRKALTEGPLKIRETVVDELGLPRIFETIKFPIGVAHKPTLLGGISVEITERERAEAALREALEFSRQVIESASEGVIVYDRDLRYRVWNRYMEDLTGMPAKDVLGCHPQELFPFLEEAGVIERLHRALNGDIGEGVEYPFSIRATGRSGWASDVTGPLRDANGEVIGVIATVREITEHKRAQERLRESGAKFRAVFQNSPDAMYVSTLEEGRILDVNEAFERLLGYTREEVTGRTVIELRCYVNLADRARLVAELKAKGKVSDFEAVARKKDGTEFLASLCIAAFVLKGELHVAGAIRDITESRRAEANLRASEARLREAERIAGVGSVVWDVETDTTIWSEEMYQIFEWPRTEPPPSWRDRSRLYTADSWTRLNAAIVRAVESGEPFEIDLEAVRPDGSIRFIRNRAETVRDADGRIVRLIGMTQDVTDRKLAEERLRQTQKNETVAIMSRGIAHDFNNLLGAILAETELSLYETGDGATLQEPLRKIEGLARRASEIVRQLMIYSGQEWPAATPVDLAALIKDILQLLHISVSKNATVKTSFERGLPVVMADGAQLRQVVMNLVLNASEAIGGKRGCIDINTSKVALKKDEVPGVPAGEYVRLEVADSGCGMSDEVRSRIFDPFYSTKSEGRGLGLATVQAIVRASGGYINVVSAPGRGSRFQVMLPYGVPVASAAPPPELPPRLPAPGLPRTVLIVEDEDALRHAAAIILERRGFTVLRAANGGEAMDLLEKAAGIDVLLLDVTIPGITSAEVLARARLLKPKAKVVLTTAYSREMVMDSFNGAEISAFLRKPYGLGELVRVLQAL